MSQNDYIKKHVDEIVEKGGYEYPLNIAMAAAWICGNFKAINLKVLDLTEMSSLADYFVFATATNTTMAKSISEEVSAQLKKHGVNVVSKEGLGDTDWILIDLGDIIVHIFQEMSREIYDLDNLWIKAPRVEIPNEYYMPDPNSDDDTSNKSNSKDDLDYF